MLLIPVGTDMPLDGEHSVVNLEHVLLDDLIVFKVFILAVEVDLGCLVDCLLNILH